MKTTAFRSTRLVRHYARGTFILVLGNVCGFVNGLYISQPGYSKHLERQLTTAGYAPEVLQWPLGYLAGFTAAVLVSLWITSDAAGHEMKGQWAFPLRGRWLRYMLAPILGVGSVYLAYGLSELVLTLPIDPSAFWTTVLMLWLALVPSRVFSLCRRGLRTPGKHQGGIGGPDVR